MSGLSREMIIHPGETLKEVLEDREMTQLELSVRTGVSPKHISTVLSGEKNISVSFAKKLEYALDIDAEFWINLQNSYDKELLDFNELHSITKEELSISRQLKSVFDFLVEKTIIPVCNLVEEKVLELRKFFNVSNLTSVPNLVSTGAFRAQTSVSVDVYTLYAWQRICEIITDSIEVECIEIEEQRKKIISAIPEIKKLMFLEQDNFVPELQRLFAKNGVAFSIVPSFKGAPVQGFIRHVNSSKTLLCMTFRQKKADIFWFSLFHELGHLVNGDAKQKFFDFESVEGNQEKKADLFAQNVLIDKTDYDTFINEGDFSISKIYSFSKAQNVLPCIVIGRLQSDKYLKWTDFSEEIIMYSET